jgi:hypothetical protein
MVQMGVGQKQQIELFRRNGERVPVPFEKRPFLVESAVDEDLHPAGFEEAAGPRHLARRTQEGDLHGRQ